MARSEENPLGRGGPLLERVAARGQRAPSVVLLPASPRRAQQLGPEARGGAAAAALLCSLLASRNAATASVSPTTRSCRISSEIRRRAPPRLVARAGALRRRRAGARRDGQVGQALPQAGRADARPCCRCRPTPLLGDLSSPEPPPASSDRDRQRARELVPQPDLRGPPGGRLRDRRRACVFL